MAVTAASAAPARKAQEQSPASVVSVAVKETQPVRLVFIEHTGPYWSVGPLFARVRTHMIEHNQSGPLFLRYSGNPWRSRTRSLGARVGFLADEDHQPEPPFAAVRRERERVAFVVLHNQAPTQRLHYTPIYEWIEANGYQAAGPVMEIYDIALWGKANASRRTEIQVSLAGPVSESLQPEMERRNAQSKATEDQLVAVDEKPAAARAETPADSHVARPIPTPKTIGQPAAQARADDREPVLSVCDLIAMGRFDRIAEQVMPEGRSIPARSQVWFGQIVFRIGAAAKAIERANPDAERIAGPIAEALTRRYREVSANFEFDPLDQAVVRVDVRNDPLASRKRSVMRDLDRLLGRLARQSAGTLDAGSVVDEFVGIVQRVQELMRAVHAGSPETTGD